MSDTFKFESDDAGLLVTSSGLFLNSEPVDYRIEATADLYLCDRDGCFMPREQYDTLLVTEVNLTNLTAEHEALRGQHESLVGGVYALAVAIAIIGGILLATRRR